MDRSSLTTLVPGDAAVALRSLPRRFREAFRRNELEGGPGAVDVAAAPGGAGPSPLSLVLAAGRSLSALRKAINRALVEDGASLPPGILDRAERDRPDEDGGTLAEALAELERASEELAADVERTPLGDWARPVAVGGQQLDALELLKEAVASARTYLDQLGPTLDALRRQG